MFTLNIIPVKHFVLHFILTKLRKCGPGADNKQHNNAFEYIYRQSLRSFFG